MKQNKISSNIFVYLMVFAIFILAVKDVSAAISPLLGAAGSYTVLAGSIVTNTGPTTTSGDVGVSPSIGVPPHVTGFPPGIVSPPGAIHDADLHAAAAQAANTAAFGALSAGANAACDVNYGAISQDLSGLTLAPGVYCANDFKLTSGTLTLDDTGNATGVWIFRSESSTLVTTPGVGATVQFKNGIASPCNVWWKVSSSATIGSGTIFIGNILALTSISLGTGATLTGAALAQTGAVTLDTNQVMICGAINPINTTNLTSLTVTKIVINDNGGTAVVGNFTLLVNGNLVLSGIANVVAPGSYVVSEIGVLGYNGTIGGDCSPNGAVTLTMGQNKTCTITNNDVPPLPNSAKLTVTKIVINNDGGTKIVSDFILKVGNVSVISGVQNTFNAGTYIVSEVSDPRYNRSFSGDCSINGTVLLRAGDVKTCTITNNDIHSKPIPVMDGKLFILLIVSTVIVGLYGFKKYGSR